MDCASAFQHALVILLFLGIGRAVAVAPVLFRTPGYEAPVRGEPDDLLVIGGSGFEASDRVVYQAVDSPGGVQNRPSLVPVRSGATLGTVPVVHVADPPYAIVVRLPGEMRPGWAYRMWVVNAAGEWSKPVSINDARPMWITPPYVYATASLPDLGRRLRVVGRNMAPGAEGSLSLKLDGPRTYELVSTTAGAQEGPLQSYVAEAALPARLVPGNYTVSVRRGEAAWVSVPGQKLEVRADPDSQPRFAVDDSKFGDCRPNDERDDSICFTRAIEAARQTGHGVVIVPRGTWDIDVSRFSGAQSGSGFIVPQGVDIRAANGRDSVIVRHGARSSPLPGALLTLSGSNSVVGITFRDADKYESIDQTRPVIQLGIGWGGAAGGGEVDGIVLSGNAFQRVGRAVVDSGRSLRYLFITGNEFGAYDNALYLTGNRYKLDEPFRIDDSVIRFNRFTPGSYLDLRAGGSGATATQLGGSHRLDFSSNNADGTSTDGLQDPADPKGWGAVFFWNISSSHEFLLVAQNQISCPGDKAGNGEAIAYDDNGNTSGFNGAPVVAAAGEDWVTVPGALSREQNGVRIPTGTYYAKHWIQVVEGPGMGQTRRISSYTENQQTGTVTFRINPKWDVVPRKGQTRIGVGNQYWQVYTVANEIEQGNPPCGKSNLSGPYGGQITQWAHTADTVIDGNKQRETSGIVLQHIYSVTAPSCPGRGQTVAFQSAVEVRRNLIDGEYSWSSDCSESGIAVLFGASAIPGSPPPVLSYGLTIDHNTIVHADGNKSGAIDITASWSDGPPPYKWAFVQNPLVFGNVIRDVSGSLPSSSCRRPMSGRIGIRFAGSEHVRDAVLYGNLCERVDINLEDGGRHTTRICPSGHTDSCECDEH